MTENITGFRVRITASNKKAGLKPAGSGHGRRQITKSAGRGEPTSFKLSPGLPLFRLHKVFKNAIRARLSPAERFSPNGCPGTRFSRLESSHSSRFLTAP